jgi:hypothetical protein
MCGMGQDNQHATAYIIKRGANIEALDTYGMTPLHRMASNNLAVGAEALLVAGADPSNTGGTGATPMQIARESRATDVIKVLQSYVNRALKQWKKLQVKSSGASNVNQAYTERNAQVIPIGFSLTCAENAWDSERMWMQLSDQKTPWYEAANGAYIYWNQGDGQWWIDAPDGKGVYVVKSRRDVLPSSGWQPLPGAPRPAPTVEIERKRPAEL